MQSDTGTPVVVSAAVDFAEIHVAEETPVVVVVVVVVAEVAESTSSPDEVVVRVDGKERMVAIAVAGPFYPK